MASNSTCGNRRAFRSRCWRNRKYRIASFNREGFQMARSGKFPGQLWTRLQPPFATESRALVCVMVLVCALSSSNRVTASPASEDIPDVTGKYEFLSEEDTLAILEEEGKLKGYIDVLQSEE